jgi:hypothetical protein
MAGLARCNKENNNCVKKDTCKRYFDTLGEPMNIYAVCNESNGYDKYIAIEVQVQTTEENTETNETANSNN